MAHENDWVADKTQGDPPWFRKTWNGLSSFDGRYIWTDGINVYYSSNTNGISKQYILNRQTSTWEPKDWGSRIPAYGNRVWTDGDDIYFSSGSDQYVFDKENSVWNEKTWTGLTSFSGLDVWNDGTDYYYSYHGSRGDIHYILNKETSTWTPKTWYGLTSFHGEYVWTDGENVYYSAGSDQYVLNKETSTWTPKTWTGLNVFAGSNIWTDNENIYYSLASGDPNDQYVLDKATSTWVHKTWSGDAHVGGGDDVWFDGGHIYYSSSSYHSELKNITSVPYRLNFPELKESIDIHDKWVSDIIEDKPDTLVKQNWGGFSAIWGQQVWTDGDKIYYLGGTNSYALNRSEKTWEPKTWYGLDSIQGPERTGSQIWTDGDNVYYSDYKKQFVLDKATSTWNPKTWNGRSDFYGSNIWTDGENIYLSGGNANYQYVLDKATSTWTAKTWNGYQNIIAGNVWFDGDIMYYSAGSNQYVFDKSTSTWIQKTWYGFTSPQGSNIWSRNGTVYYSDGRNQFVLDKTTSTWSAKTWEDAAMLYASGIWTDGEEMYYSYMNDNNQYRITDLKITTVPYRLNFPKLQESIDPHDNWLIDDDIPYRMDFPELKESFDLNGSWVTHKIPDPSTAGLRFLKLSYNLTVNWAGGGTNNITVSTDIPEAFKRSDHLWIYSGMSYRDVAMVINTEIPQCPYQCQMTFDSAGEELLETLDFIAPKFYIYRTRNASRLAAFSPQNIDSSLYSESRKNVDLVDDRTYLATPYNYACEPRVTFNFGSGGSFPNEPGSTVVAIDIIFAFTADQDDRYADLLARYPDHVTPFEYVKNAVPYRLNFPPLIPSIDPDSWLIDDDIPYRLDFPPLIPSASPADSWLQDKGWDPRRPWPEHRSIIQKVQTIPNIPDVDWTKSMQQTFEFYTVDPNNWYDDQKLENIISCDLTHDLTSDKRGNASITVSESLPECYIRTYLVVTQAGYMHKICLGTYLYMTSSDSFDGMKHNITMTGYTPMVELEEKLPPLGFHIVGITNRKHSGDAPMVTDAIKDIVTTYTRCEIENRTVIQKPLLNDFVAGSNDNFLTVINNILNASSLQQYILTVDEWGTIIVKDKPVLEDAIPTYIYTDDNSSILLPSLDTNDDIYGIPNVVEVLYTGDKRLPAIRVIVKNEDPTSIVSIPARGREIAKRFTITNIAAPVNDYSEAAVRAQVTAQAERLLEAASTINKTISYSHGYCDVKVGDTVLINYERAGVTSIRAKVVSQRISCKPGCQVDEQAVYTKKLWNRGV